VTWVEIKQFDQTGLNTDQPTRALPLNTITSASNIGFKNGKLAKLLGYDTVYGTPTVAPYHLQHAVTADNDPWVIYCGLNDVYSYYSNTHTKITRTLSTYAATKNNDWTSTVLGGIVIINEGANVPQYTTNYAVEFQNLPNWPSSWTCASIRSFREFLVAMDMMEGGIQYPQKLRWSHPSDPGSLPSSWDETDTTKDAGYKSFAETPGIMIDCLPMGSMNVVYKSDSAYAMQYIGGQFVFSFNKLFDIGLVGRNAVCEFEGKHCFVSDDDIYVHSGGTPISITYKRLRDHIFGEIDQNYRDRIRVVADKNRQKIWIFIPTNGTGWLNEAYIWSWRDNTWENWDDLPNLTCASVGGEVDSSQTWDADSGTWDSDNTVWNSSLAVSSQVLLGSALNTKLYQGNYLNQAEGVNFTAEAQRTGLDFGDPNSIKLVRKLRPHFNDMTDGTQVTISVGSQEYPDKAVTWSDHTYTIGSSNEIWPLVRGRYLAWKVSMTANDAMELESLEFDVIKNGSY
jgi:hypothetical protein